jgi:Domain of unknown function (DUF1905)
MIPIGGGARFRAPLAWTGGATAGFVVPPEVLAELGGGNRPAIVATVNGHRFSTSIGLRDGWHWLPADERAVSGAVFGQIMEVEVELSTTGRSAVRATASRVCRPGRRDRPGYPRPRRP